MPTKAFSVEIIKTIAQMAAEIYIPIVFSLPWHLSLCQFDGHLLFFWISFQVLDYVFQVPVWFHSLRILGDRKSQTCWLFLYMQTKRIKEFIFKIINTNIPVETNLYFSSFKTEVGKE